MKHRDKRSTVSGQAAHPTRDADDRLTPDWYKGVTLADDSDGTELKSVIFRRFAAPLCSGREELQQMRINFGVAMMGWNLALMPPHVRMKTLADTLRGFPEAARHLVKDHLAQLVDRKERKFADYSWMIQSFHLEEERDGISLYVAALGEGTEVMMTTPEAAAGEAEA